MLCTVNQLWKTISEIEHAKFILVLAAVAILISVAVYVVNWARGLAFDKPEEPEGMLTDFQQLKSEGKISDAEFERVKRSAISPEHLPEQDVGVKSDPGSKPDQTDTSRSDDSSEITPTDAPPITLAEALARRKQETKQDEAI